MGEMGEMGRESCRFSVLTTFQFSLLFSSHYFSVLTTAFHLITYRLSRHLARTTRYPLVCRAVQRLAT